MRSPNYWETETPIIVSTKNNTFRWYKQAGRLQVCMPDFEDRNGKSRPGKVVTVHINAAKDNVDVLELIREAFKI